MTRSLNLDDEASIDHTENISLQGFTIIEKVHQFYRSDVILQDDRQNIFII